MIKQSITKKSVIDQYEFSKIMFTLIIKSILIHNITVKQLDHTLIVANTLFKIISMQKI